MKRTKSVSARLAAALLAGAILLPAQKMNYHDVSELSAALATLDRQSAHVRRFTIGYSYSIAAGNSTGTAHTISAVRISESTTTIRDDPGRNSILFECGSHAREWMATQSCLTLATYLANNAQNEGSGVPALLRKADVYIIPLTNIAGRLLDDNQEGDPEEFNRDVLTAGWRGNGDRRDCNSGTDIARNFSRNWSNATANCAFDYRGFAPFSSSEASALRQFVQNQSVSMVVIVHTNAEQINNYWEDAPGNGNVALAQWIWFGGLGGAPLGLAESTVGTGLGQFSAWLAQTSDTAGEPDLGTRRGIRTIFVELPITSDHYAAPYRFAPNDRSNGFHPSGQAGVTSLLDNSFIPLAKHFIGYAGSPECNPRLAICPAVDFGLMGAKIAIHSLRAGAIETQPAYKLLEAGRETIMPARDYLAAGRYSVYYRVQNLTSLDREADVAVTVEDGVAPVTVTRTYNLRASTGTFDRVEFDFDGNAVDYKVTIEVRPRHGFVTGANDDFTDNNKKIFKFRSYMVQ